MKKIADGGVVTKPTLALIGECTDCLPHPYQELPKGQVSITLNINTDPREFLDFIYRKRPEVEDE